MKKLLSILLLICFGLIVISHTFCLFLANSNYKYNNEFWNQSNYTGLIYNQHEYTNMKYGLGSIAKNGCGAVAVYNILVLENKYEPLPEIVKYFDNSNEVFYGILGTNSFSIVRYMKKKGYEANIYFNYKNFKEKAVNSKYSILMYFNLKGGHFQLMYNYNENSDAFNFINTTTTMPFETLLDKTSNCFRLLITVN